MLPRSTPFLSPVHSTSLAALWLVRHGQSSWNTLGLICDPGARPAGGEPIRDEYRRAAAFCDDLASRPRDEEGDVVVIAHGGTLRVLRAYLSHVPVEQMRWEALQNARVLRIDGYCVNPRGGTE
jgi:broad specificity phosphatase PhoE